MYDEADDYTPAHSDAEWEEATAPTRELRPDLPRAQAATPDELSMGRYQLGRARSKAGLRETWNALPDYVQSQLKVDSIAAAARIETEVAAAASQPLA